MTILDTLAESARKTTDEHKQKVSLKEIKELALGKKNRKFAFIEALKEPELSYICELKKASPSKGLICENFDYLRFAKEYENNGASAISCLTEPTKFLGSVEILEDVTALSQIPVLRKDFIVDPYQIYEARAAGADAILLICAILSQEELDSYLALAHELGMNALVEIHDEDELEMALRAGARIVGVNNRNLKDFTVDLNNSVRLAPLIPDEVVFVSESGIHSKEDIDVLKKAGVDAVLIGEQLMASGNIPKALEELMDEN